MAKPKEEVRRILDELSDDSSYEDIQYHIDVRQKIERGLQAAERGDIIDQEEVERRMEKWLAEQGGRLLPGKI